MTSGCAGGVCACCGCLQSLRVLRHIVPFLHRHQAAADSQAGPVEEAAACPARAEPDCTKLTAHESKHHSPGAVLAELVQGHAAQPGHAEPESAHPQHGLHRVLCLQSWCKGVLPSPGMLAPRAPTLNTAFTVLCLQGLWKGVLPSLVMVANPTVNYMLYEVLLARLADLKRRRRGIPTGDPCHQFNKHNNDDNWRNPKF